MLALFRKTTTNTLNSTSKQSSLFYHNGIRSSAAVCSLRSLVPTVSSSFVSSASSSSTCVTSNVLQNPYLLRNYSKRVDAFKSWQDDSHMYELEEEEDDQDIDYGEYEEYDEMEEDEFEVEGMTEYDDEPHSRRKHSSSSSASSSEKQQSIYEDDHNTIDSVTQQKILNPTMERFFLRLLDRIEHEEKYADEPRYKSYGITPALFKLSYELFSKQFMHKTVFDEGVQKAFASLKKRPGEMTDLDLMYKLYLQDVMQRFPSHFVNQQDMTTSGATTNESDFLSTTDLKKPHEWYPAARMNKRKIFVHTGPTNSGKTHSAFERLRQAKTGVYCAPLRLLATEGYVKLTEKGVKCNLMTGDYKVEVDGHTHTSSTVEMVDVNQPVEIAVIDEIQLIGDEERGWAWTRVLLGINADEIHVCGEERALKLIEHLCEVTGDELEVTHYKRLTPLKVTARSTIMEDYRNIRQGDCIVAFSRKEVFKIKHEVERLTNLKVAVVYGSLPPKVRLEQSKLFNSETSKYDVLVATDAIGMGLNLNIRRLVFHSVEKFDGTIRRQLEPWEIRQIAGRAGRYGSLYPKGEVTCLKNSDCKVLQTAFMLKQLPDIEAAGLFPPVDQIEYFTRQFSPEQKLSSTLDSFYKLTETDAKYFMCNIDDRKAVADLLHGVKELTFRERMQFLNAPIDTSDPNAMRIAKSYARHHSKGVPVPLIVELPQHQPQTIEQLREIESIYKILDVYCWLSYRFSETFVMRDEAREYQARLLTMIQASITKPVNALFLSKERRANLFQNALADKRRYRKETFRRERDRLMQELEEMGIFNEYMTADPRDHRRRRRGGNRHQQDRRYKNQRRYR